MFALFKNGGKQYKAYENQVLRLEKINAEAGEEFEISEVMAIGGEKISIGSPYVAGASIKCQLVDHEQGEKVIIFKKRRRKNYRRKNGHRQQHSLVKILSITAGK